MKATRYIKLAIRSRANHAMRFLEQDAKIVEWMERNGIDVCDPRFSHHILTGAESLCNPYASADELIKLIKEYEPRERKAVKWDG